MIKVVGIGGEPATGKSTIMRGLIASVSPAWRGISDGLVRGLRHMPRQITVFGEYAEGEQYPGTDRLSMAVQPEVLRYMERHYEMEWTFLFEGDRLFNGSFLDAVTALTPNYLFVILTATDQARAMRRAGREDTKSVTFLKGRATKYERLGQRADVRVLPNDTMVDGATNLALLERHVVRQPHWRV